MWRRAYGARCGPPIRQVQGRQGRLYITDALQTYKDERFPGFRTPHTALSGERGRRRIPRVSGDAGPGSCHVTLRAGAAVREITPCGPTALFGYPHIERISTGVHDPLLASALVLDNGNDRAVIAALDLLFLDPPTARELRGAAACAADVPASNVFVSCSHTHSGPVTTRLLAWHGDPAMPSPDSVFLERVRDELVEAVGECLASLQDAELAWTSADGTGVGGNRDDPEGVTDPECGVLAVRSASDHAPIAVSVVYGMHPTVLHEDTTLVSSDFVHYTRLHIREQLWAPVPILYHTAPCGNQSPRHVVRGQTFAEAERLGRVLGAAVGESILGIVDEEWNAESPLRGAVEVVDLPRRRLPSSSEAREMLRRCRAEYDRLCVNGAFRPALRTAECAVFGAEGVVALAQAQERGEIERVLRDHRPLEVQVVRIGEACLAGLPGEVFSEYSLEIKRGAPCRTHPVAFVNGELQGYVVTEEADARGGYEAATSVYAPGAGGVLVDAALRLIRGVHPGW